MEPADFYARSDSFTFFDRLGDVLMTGPSGNNVRDVRLLVAE
jgi:glycerate-2-kinase